MFILRTGLSSFTSLIETNYKTVFNNTLLSKLTPSLLAAPFTAMSQAHLHGLQLGSASATAFNHLSLQNAAQNWIALRIPLSQNRLCPKLLFFSQIIQCILAAYP